MKRVIGSFIMVVLLYLLQTTIFNNIAIAGVKPNVILIPIVIVGYRYGRVQGMVLGFFTGLFIDLNESDYLGYYALFYLITYMKSCVLWKKKKTKSKHKKQLRMGEKVLFLVE